MKVQGHSNIPYYPTRAPSQTPPFTSAAPTQPPSSAATAVTDPVQFETQMLVALLNAQQGQFDGPPQHLANLSAGEAPIQSKAPHFIGRRPDMAVSIISSAGDLDRTALQGQSAAILASHMVDTFGSHGALSVSDVERALGCDSSTADPQTIAKIRRGIESDWNAMTDGRASLSTDQLARAIQSYLLNG